MRAKILPTALAACALVAIDLAVCFGYAEQKLKAEEIVARHLAAIGTDQARAAATARLATGRSGLRVVVGEALSYGGTAEIASEGHRLMIALPFKDVSYWGEQFLFDGQRPEIGFVQPGQRSQLGGFLARYPELVREGLVGGVLTTAWPLLDVAGRQPKLQAKGVQRVDGQELQRLEYVIRKGGSETTITLFFDSATFRHVRSTYAYTRAQQIGTTIESSSQQRETHYELEERFEDFKSFDGITLPTHWSLRYSADTTNRTTNLAWDVLIEAVSHSPRFDANTFVLKPHM
jgi:hypothetical protein